MAVAYLSAGNGAATEASGGNLNPTCPATVTAGDILIAHVAYEGTTTTPSTPADWTVLGEATGYTVESAYKHWIFGKIAIGDEDGAAVSFGTPAVTTMRTGRIYSFSGRTSGTISQCVPSTSFAHQSHATDPAFPSVTTTAAGALAVAAIFQADDNTLASATGESGGDWTEAVAEYMQTATTPDSQLGLQTCTPTANPGTVTGGTISTANDPCGVIGFQILAAPPPPTASVTDAASPGESISITTYPNNAIVLNGSSQYGTIANFSAIDAMTNGTLTYETWYVVSSTSVAYSHLWFLGDTTNKAAGCETENATGSTGVNFTYEYDGTPEADGYQSSGVFSNTSWKHFAFVAQTGQPTKIYSDGTEISYILQNTPVGTANELNGFGLYLGFDPRSGGTKLTGRIGGFVRLWNTVRTGAEINANKSTNLQASGETGLIVNLKFTESSGTTIDNEATAGADCNLTGTPSWTGGPAITEKTYDTNKSILVTDGAAPGEIVAPQIPKNYITVIDGAAPGEIIAAQIPKNYIAVTDASSPGEIINVTQSGPRISVLDNAAPGEIVIPQIPKNYVSVLDSAAPGEIVTAYTSAVNISVADAASPGDLVLAHIPRNYISVVDSAAPGELSTILIPSYNVSVLDSASPGEIVTTHIPRNYISVSDLASPGDLVIAQIPKNYITVADGVTANDTVSAAIPAPAQASISVTDAASPGEVVSAQIPRLYITVLDGTTPAEVISINSSNPQVSVLDTATPGENLAITQSSPRISVTDAASPGEVVVVAMSGPKISVTDAASPGDLITTHIPRNYISVIDAASPGDLVVTHVPKNYITVTDGTTVTDVVIAQVPVAGVVQINVTDGTTTAEVLAVQIPRVYISVADAASPSEVIALSVPVRVSVIDAGGVGEAIAVKTSNPNISVTDSVTPTETVNIKVSGPRISVADAATPGEVVTAHIPKNYINVTDQATPGEALTVYIPKNYISVIDAAAPGEVAGVVISAAGYINVIVTDQAAPGEVVGLTVSNPNISVVDTVVPGEVVNVITNNLIINVADGLTVGEVVTAQPSQATSVNILVTDEVRPGEKRKVAKSHTGIGPKTQNNWYVDAPKPFETKNNPDWYDPDPKSYKTANNPDWYKKY